MNYRFGFDVGTNSLGWCVLALNNQNKPCRIEATGSRIFTDGRVEKNRETTLKATRRDARSARRRRDRFKQRQRFLISELKKAGLLPEDELAMKELQKQNPLLCRKRALTEKLPPHHIGRALFHINQRRGFKSNRKDSGEENVRGGVVDQSIRYLLQEMDLIKVDGDNAAGKGKTEEKVSVRNALKELQKNKKLSYGSFLCERYESGQSTRARPGAGSDGKLYDVYPNRKLYEDEFNKIWEAQRIHHPEIMTAQVRERICRAIFHQRPLKHPGIGYCAYLPEERRVHRAMPGFQRYRMYQEVNNLEWYNGNQKFRLIDYKDGRDAVIDLLERDTTKSEIVKWPKIEKTLKKLDLLDGYIDLGGWSERDGLECNITSKLMRQSDCVGKQWDEWPIEKQDEFIDTILKPKESENGKLIERDDEEVRLELIEKYVLSEEAADKCINARFAEGTANLSLRAARLLTEKMEGENIRQHEAIETVAKDNKDFKNPYTRVRRGEVRPSLPYYGIAFQDGRHIIPGNNDPDEEDMLKRHGGVSNPTVHIAMNQIRQVVNELIRRYGHPYSIAIELGRDLPAGAKGLARIKKRQKENKERNEELDKKLEESKQRINRANRLRLSLWEEQDKQCMYSGKKIGHSELFSDAVEVDHIIPYSKSLDDGRANKVLCTRQANRDKGDRTPYDAFHDNPQGYNWDEIMQRAHQLSGVSGGRGRPSILWRFGENVLEELQKDDEFLERQLNDTRYIGRMTREYLECICDHTKIDVVTGRLTSLLRKNWGLNSILSEIESTHAGANDSKETETERPDGEKDSNDRVGYWEKNRNDHRHHAIDAIVIGLTTRLLVQKVATEAARAEEQDMEHLIPKIDHPWDNFRQDVREIISGIIVSHKAKRKLSGQLHKEYAYGIAKHQDKDKFDEKLKEYGRDVQLKIPVIMRKPIENFTTEQNLNEIRSPKLREAFFEAYDDAKHNAEKGKEGVLRLARKKKIRHLRVMFTRSVQPIRNKEGEIYKAFWLRNNWATEIYEYPQGHSKAGKWEGVTISLYEAVQKGFQPGFSCRPHSNARFVMRLQINDCIEIEENGQRRIMRVHKMSSQRLRDDM